MTSVKKTPITALPGVGPKKESLLGNLGIETVEDLILYYPRTYEDRRNKVPVGSLAVGIPAVFTAMVVSVQNRGYGGRGRKAPFILLAGDETGTIEIIFFSSNYLDKIFKVGEKFLFFGTPAENRGKLQITHPDFERWTDGAETSTHPILPIYPLTAGLTQKDFRKWQLSARFSAENTAEYLPEKTIERNRLCSIAYALSNVHFPADRDALKAARARLIFEELLILRIGLAQMKKGRDLCVKGISFRADTGDYRDLFPFALTGAQVRVIDEIYADMESSAPMNRLVQGDVGSGKTAVAIAALAKAAMNGYQSVMMVPTEILAKQHFAELTKTFAGINKYIGRKINVGFLSGSMKAAEKRETLRALATGEIDIITGTHAILEPDVVFLNPGLVITDEQHRFGVNQRITVSRKGDNPDILVMTATPIPRTLAYILYGDLDISIIDELPPGRKSITTKAVGSDKRNEVYRFIESELAKGRQAYVVAPLIEDNDDSPLMADVRSVEQIYKELTERFPAFHVALIHGAMKQSEKDRIMDDFNSGNISLLVSTVVIEVGINVRNATVMVIENSERFGLAQLHQLRGRVGRGADKSYCILVSDSKTPEALRRNEVMTGTNDGFVIAEEDLKMRGPGDLFGLRQHGIPDLRIADLARHIKTAERAGKEANVILDDDPSLKKPKNSGLRQKSDKLFGGKKEIGL